MVLTLLLAGPAAAAPRLVTLDWTIAETLTALGMPPQGVAQTAAYRDWVAEPSLPDTVVDLGLRVQPNLELLADLDPDRILISPMFASLEPRLSHIAPVTTVSLYAGSDALWPDLLAATRKLARLGGRPEAAERLIATTEARIADLRERLPEGERPLLMVQFMDARHVRVFGEHSLYQAVAERLGLDNAWQGTTNAWGFSLVGLEALAGIDAQLVVVDPLPVGVEQALADNGLWQHLAAVREGRVLHLPPVWSFGGLPSAERFAEQLVPALEASRSRDS
ncbi:MULTISPECIES: iron-siderophore ABC transporter substrate-binding protein [unclassified Modicisalibacter]|uniref:iron-siderophore ABC transporter substrate-binding protein n=1 Tax=unclassified Modicisalibacter TaxID=2679913 RepID=UPI001CCE0D52|nr:MULTISPECIES: iron-siderophore ABC transporter substrate-binding protein [unclassified Modicisalibacter]MBZ9558045.1 iron-siderophore ABC transporter substrate-binding protein [Modicisalibacter sp. R2A 31.J]MBZ9573287.1 iron-siderophore ABC transporter substrate-binding protein [Modicisalibacter sp. MOD 31.J]